MNKLASELPYKVEMKPTIWEVTLERGSYSDRTEEHLFFSGNTQEEVWEFFKRYETENNKDIRGHVNYEWNDLKLSFSGPFKDNFNHYKITIPASTKPREDNWYGGWMVSIERLDVIYFKK